PTSPNRSIWTSCPARSPPSPAGRTVTDRPRRSLRSLHAPAELGPGLASPPVANHDPQPSVPGVPGQAGEPVGGRASIQRLIGGVGAELRAGSDEEAVARLFPERHQIAAQVGGDVILARPIGQHGAKTNLDLARENEGIAGSCNAGRLAVARAAHLG